jgi:glyoxylase-like metal-dependent hydrolase (beta-lactamase superfamily II)
MSSPECIDLVHMGLAGSIGCYLIDATEPTIVDPGPASTLGHLLHQLSLRGIGSQDVRHVVLTHIHIDHAGATGHLVELCPNATVYVHEDGLPHMVDPTRLVKSTRRIFGDLHDRLWGEVDPVPADRIRAWREGEPGPWPGLRPIPTPGHIDHHLAYLDERDGTLFSGDAMGIAFSGSPPHPPTPPPAVDLRAWSHTLDKIGEIGPERFGATHFGVYEDVQSRRAQLQERLDALEARVRAALAKGDPSDRQRFAQEVRDELTGFMGRDVAERYFRLFSAEPDWDGVAFYLERSGREQPGPG